MTWQKWPNPSRLAVEALGRALNGSQAWEAFTGWDGSGSMPALSVPVGEKRPGSVPADGRFIRVLLVAGSDVVPGGFVEAHLIEIEAYAADPWAAWDLLMAARAALWDIQGQTVPSEIGPIQIRRVVETSKPSPLPTGRDGEERFRMGLEIHLSARG